MTDDNFFGRDVAATYDQDHGGTDPDLIQHTVDLLCDLAQGGSVLEFAVGTGRIALPMKERGVYIAGIELSVAMVDALRKKETGTPIPIEIGDMTTARSGGGHALVFLVFNTIDNLTSQDAQAACFANAASHLTPGGRFLVETLVPPLQRIPLGETSRAFSCTPDHWGIDTFDVTTQQYTSHHIWRRQGTCQQVSVPFRYVWPAELDLMAKMAGMVLEHRWADWTRAPFTNLSTSHISVWRKP